MVAELAALPAFAFGATYLLHSTLLLGCARLVTRRMDTRALRLREEVRRAEHSDFGSQL